jgi:hypothetical protein
VLGLETPAGEGSEGEDGDECEWPFSLWVRHRARNAAVLLLLTSFDR